VLLKTAALRCYQIHHAVSRIIDEVPLHSAWGVARSAEAHQTVKSSLATGGVDRIQDNNSCQIVLAKGHPVSATSSPPIDRTTSITQDVGVLTAQAALWSNTCPDKLAR
jgi:hypothetical protein